MEKYESASFSAKKEQMLVEQLMGRGIADQAVLNAMREVPREAFVVPEMTPFAYEDSPLPIEEGQTISQPYIVAYMIEALELTGYERVLEIGTGSGYAAAVLSRVAAKVFTVERIKRLAQKARKLLQELEYENIDVMEGDGSLGWRENAPYDAIVVAAGAPDVPGELIVQLAPGGRLVIPVGPSPQMQTLVRMRKLEGGQTVREELCGVRFVPLIGKDGW